MSDMSHVVELHLHLDGSLRPETVWELAKEQGVELPAKSAEEVKYKMEVPEDCKTLEEYLERFDLPLLVLQRADAIERVTFELVEDLANEGVDYAEIRFAPQLSVNGCLTQDEVVEAAIRGAERGMKAYPQIRVGLILCCMRGADNEALNMQTVENFAPVFAKVREYGIPMTIHAGEAAGPDSMKTALSFGTRRIGHGVAAIDDPELIKRLIDEKVTLEVCVTSNYHTKVVPAINMHPIHKLLEKGVHVTVNSDNRTCSRTTLQKEKEVLKEELGFTDEEIEKMQEYAWEARFLK